MVPDSNDAESFSFEPSCSGGVVVPLLRMLATVKLNDESTL
jgi:hypothetical protein